jgi:hypothetical protein
MTVITNIVVTELNMKQLFIVVHSDQMLNILYFKELDTLSPDPTQD